MTERTIVVGDLHGCLVDASKLLDKCVVSSSDRVIFTGDLVDRGPDSGGCVDLVRAIEQRQGAAACILGNHEERHCWYHDQETKYGSVTVTAPYHEITRTQLRPEHYNWFRGLPLYIRLPEHNAIVVHAGLWPNRAVEDQDPYHLLHIQMIDPGGMVEEKWGNEGKNQPKNHNEKSKWPSKAPKGWIFWTNLYQGTERVIFGHSVLDRPLVTDKVVGIDGGGVFGRSLWALVLPEWEIVSLDCTTDYGKGSRGRSLKPIKTFPIHGEVSTFS